MNVVCVVEHGNWTSDIWTDKGNVAEALARYEGWHPTVRSLIQAFPETFIWALHDRLPLPQLERRPGHAAGRRLPSHAALHGAGRGAVDRGWRGAGGAADGDAGRCAGRAARATRRSASRARRACRRRVPPTARASICMMGPSSSKRDEAMATSGDRSIANIGWLYMHDAGAVA